VTNEEMNALVRKHKTALTKARNSGEWIKIKAAAQSALEAFDALPAWPDNWRLWQIALDDAISNLERGRTTT